MKENHLATDSQKVESKPQTSDQSLTTPDQKASSDNQTLSTLKTQNSNSNSKRPSLKIVEPDHDEISYHQELEANDLTSLLSNKPNGEIQVKSVPDEINAKCQFNGYSNNEILIFFSIAFFTSISFYIEQTQFVLKVRINFD